MIRVPIVLLLSSLFVRGSAQTFVVDANNGPGTDYTSLAVATAAAPDGAVLLVRSGAYLPPVTIVGKSMVVLAEPGAEIQSSFSTPHSLTISGLGAGQAVYVRGLRMFAPSFHTQTGLRCQNSAGRICVEDVKPSPTNGGSNNLVIDGCAAVWLRDCAFVGRSTIANSEAVLADCVMPGTGGIQQNGLEQFGGSVQLVDCAVRGVTIGPGIHLLGGSLRLLGNTLVAGGSTLTIQNALAITGSGDVRKDTSVVLTGVSPVVAATITVTTTSMPHVTVVDVPPTGTVDARLHGPQGQPGLMIVSLTGPVFSLPFLADTVWLDPLSMLVLAAGVPGPGAPVASQVFVPAVSTTVGFQLAWQGLTLDTTGLQISNPVYTIVR